MKNTKKWFTLIELMISITIFMILTLFTYANYAFYQNIASVKLSLKEVSQSLATARNMATSWYQQNNINQKVWVLFEKNSNILKFYSFNYNSWVIINDVNLIKTEYLQRNILINNISIWWTDKQNIFIIYSSIYWTWWIYDTSSANPIPINEKEIKFDISFKNANSFPLKRELTHNILTNISDY